MWKVVFTTTSVYFVYVLFGGCIFLLLEGIDQLNVRSARKSNYTALNFTEMHYILLENNYTSEDINEVVKEWYDDKARNYFENGTVTLQDRAWTYSNAFFFAFHICTTIGYGDITPSTTLGEILAVLYAIFGIPLNIIFYKLLGESFAQSYQETIWRIKGEEDSPNKKMLGDLGFFLPWTLIFFFVPSIIFMYTENWNFIEGIYYSFITLTTVGLGDYVAGGGVKHTVYYILYKLVLLCWMIYGMAFTAMIVDYLTYLYQKNLLFDFNCKWKQGEFGFKRVYVDVEKLDIHFRLLRAEGAKHKYTMWSVRKGALLTFDFQAHHLANLAVLSEKIQSELIKLLDEYDTEENKSSADVPKDAFPVKIPQDAFPVKKQTNEQ